MKFDLSDDQLTLQEAVRDYFSTRFPLSEVRSVIDAGAAHDDRAWKGLMDLGIGAVAIPEEYGGLGLGVLDVSAAMEMIGYSLGPTPVLGHVLGTLAVVHAGSDEQRQRWLPDLATGEVRGAVVFQSAGKADSAVLDAVDADVLIVERDDGLAVVEVDDRVSIEQLPSIDRTRTLSRVRMNDVAAQALPGGQAVAPWLRDVALTLLAADAMGGASRCVELTVDYVSVRQQWGVVVGSFQAVKHQLANLALRVEPARGLYWYAAHMLDQNTENGADASRAAALAKAHTTERFVEAGREAVELHGGIGYTWECDVHFFLKRALVDRAYLEGPRRLYARVADLSGW